jgi:hypothetical protein
MLALCLVNYVMVSSILMCQCTLVVVDGVVVAFLVHLAHVVEVVVDVVLRGLSMMCRLSWLFLSFLRMILSMALMFAPMFGA